MQSSGRGSVSLRPADCLSQCAVIACPSGRSFALIERVAAASSYNVREKCDSQWTIRLILMLSAESAEWRALGDVDYNL